MNTSECIKRHLYYDYSLSKAITFLDESMGFHDSILGMAKTIYGMLLKEMHNRVEKTGCYYGTFCVSGSDIPESFFDKLILNIMYFNEHVPYSDIAGSYEFVSSGKINNEYVVTINVISHSQDDEFENKMISFLCHELTHAYDDYMEFRSTGQSYVQNGEKKEINRLAFDDFYKDYQITKDKNVMDLYSVIQYTLKVEKEADQASFASEIMLKRHGNLIGHYSTISDFFHDTEAYKTLSSREEMLDSLENIKDDDERKKLVSMFNKVYIESHRDYEEMINFLRKKFNAKKHRMIKIGSKAISRVVEMFVSEPIL